MKKIIISLLVVAVLGGIVAYMQYNKPHQNIEKASAEAKIEATALFEAYTKDEATANQKYTGKIVEVSGKVKEVSKASDGTTKINLEVGDAMFGVSCSLDPKNSAATTLIAGNTATLKGKCDGFNMDVQLSNCVIR
jgi:Tfp pilus assembly protein PilE